MTIHTVKLKSSLVSGKTEVYSNTPTQPDSELTKLTFISLAKEIQFENKVI